MNAVTKTFDPYAELDVDRHASASDIKKSYREACKTAHPDAGGNALDWERLQLAYNVLSDPARRKSYDDTGTVEEVKPDNDRASALQVIEMHMHDLINDFLLKGQQPLDDPRRKNLITAIGAKIGKEIMDANNAMPNGRSVAAFWMDLKERFTIKTDGEETDNFFAARLNDQARITQGQMADLERDIRVRERALKILDSYQFRYDLPSQASFSINPDDYHQAKTSPYTWPQHINQDGSGKW